MNSKVSGDPLHADLETADCLSRHSTMTTSVSVAPSAINNCIVENQARPTAEDSHGLADQTEGGRQLLESPTLQHPTKIKWRSLMLAP